MKKCIILILLCLNLFACASTRKHAEFLQGERDFKAGYYKKSLANLLPLAADGDAKAQYAVGYMYYYGYGVPQDVETGLFWIKRAAQQHYLPAIKAVEVANKNNKVLVK